MNYQDVYNENYYNHYTPLGLVYKTDVSIQQLSYSVVDSLVPICKPKTLLDVGCAMGHLVKIAREEFSIEAFGMDVSQYAIANSVAPSYCFEHDASKYYHFRERFDIVTCIEVVEHMPELEALNAISNLTLWANKYIYFSSTSEDEDESTHINVKPDTYWVELFDNFGFMDYPYFRDNRISWGHLFIRESLIR